MNAAHESSESFVVRKALAADAGGIPDCLRSAFEPYRADYTPDGFSDTILSPATIRSRFREMTLFVALTPEREVIGTIGCNIVGGGEGHLRGMAVRPDHQGSGVAQRLLLAVETELRGQGCTKVTLDTTEVLKRARRFYERNGYRVSGVVR
ncbi:MAG: GNAT family N-acetyltransferase, partial [Ignavibacteria bacterium]|nr:GNAT family N-acetyltransferase [Ignavibacteria bacterium]